MKVKVLYFAYLRDAVGRPSETVEVPAGVETVGALRDYLVGQGDPWKSGFESVKRIRFSVNQAMADETAAIKDGDEVAFFPPVTGTKYTAT